MPDAGEVKAKVIIEYDGSGIKQAKEDLASLAESARSVGQSAEKASDGLSGLDGQLSSNAESARGFSNVLADLPKMTEAGGAGVAEMTSALVEQRTAVEEAGTAQEEFGKQVETTASNLEKVAPAMQSASEHTKGLNENISQIQQSFSDLSATIAEPGATEAYTKLWQSVAGESLGASPLGNFEVFQKAYNAIDPSGMYDAAGGMQMINDHLDRTGQSYEQFAGTFSDKNQQLLHEMSMDWSQMGATVEGTGQSFQKTGEKAQSGFSTIASSAGDADQAVAEFLGKTNKSMSSSAESTGQWVETTNGFMAKLGGVMEGPAYSKPVSLGGAFSEVASGVGNMLNEIAMPLMAVQMIGMAVGQVGQAMYDSAAIAEGPAAHSFGTFTGTVDALGQSLQNASGQFSEGFGQELLPTLNALNSQAGSSDLGGLGHFVGGIATTLANLSLITTGIDPLGGTEGLINQGASMLGLQQPFQGPAPVSQYQQQMNALPQTVHQNAQQLQYQGNLTMAEATNPEWLAQNNENIASQGAAAYLVANYNSSHPIPRSQVIAQAQERTYDAQQQQNYQYQMNNQPSWAQDVGDYWGGFFATANTPPRPLSNPNPNSAANQYGSNYYGQNATGGGGGGGGGIDIGGFFGGIGKSISDMWNAPNGGADTLGMLFSPQAWGFGGQASPQTSLGGGCFVAGTPVLMADGSSKAIEALRFDERVLAYDGEKQVPATIVACIEFPAKQTYALTFSDGNMLVTTDSHPLAGVDGWKSISPASTAQENPGLPVTMLTVGDSIYTAAGTLCRLISIQKREITTVYNITVDNSHTYYAAGILVHNAKQANVGPQIGQQASEQIGDIQLPHMDLSSLSSQLGGNFSGIQLPHMDMSGISAGLGGAFSGISLPHIDMSGISGSLAGAFSGISMPPMPAIGSEISGALGGMFSGISMPPMPAIGSEISGALGGMFSGISIPAIPDIGGSISGALSGMFGSISIPSPPQVGGMISGAMSGIFGGIQPPSPPEVGAMINGVMGGIFSGITVPSPPNVGAMISGAMSSMFSGISMPSVPFFASGVSNFSGGPAVVGEGGAPEVVGYNGGYSLFDKGAAFVNLPSGASVYPMKNLGGSSVAQFADGTGGGSFSPLSLGRGGMPQSVNVAVHLDSQMILSALQLPFAQDIRVQSGNRSY